MRNVRRIILEFDGAFSNIIISVETHFRETKTDHCEPKAG